MLYIVIMPPQYIVSVYYVILIVIVVCTCTLLTRVVYNNYSLTEFYHHFPFTLKNCFTIHTKTTQAIYVTYRYLYYIMYMYILYCYGTTAELIIYNNLDFYIIIVLKTHSMQYSVSSTI